MERHLIGDDAKRLFLRGDTSGQVGIKISGSFAGSLDGQRLLWNASNLACRVRGPVSGVKVCVPEGTAVAEPNLVRPGPWSGSLSKSLAGALGARSRGCDVSVVHGDLGTGTDVDILLGPGTGTDSGSAAQIHASCSGWLADCWYGEAPPGLRAGSNDGNPFGAAAAACIAVCEALKQLGRRGAERPWDSTRFSMYDLRTHDTLGGAPANPPLPGRIDAGSVCVCGCGAVGNALCQYMGMVPGIRADLHLVDRLRDGRQNDERIDDENLARYVMCTNDDVGRPKAATLAERMGGRRDAAAAADSSGLTVSHTDGGLGSLARGGKGRIGYAVSCLDNDPARRELQDLLPRRVLGGSAYGLQSQVSVYDTAVGTQCLKCYNRGGDAAPTPDAVVDGAEPKGTALPAAGDGRACPPGPKCGSLDSEDRSRIGIPDGEEFSINFTTSLSGAVLAAETVKAACGQLAPALDCRPKTDMFYSFWGGVSNLRVTKPRAGCWCGKIGHSASGPDGCRSVSTGPCHGTATATIAHPTTSAAECATALHPSKGGEEQ